MARIRPCVKSGRVSSTTTGGTHDVGVKREREEAQRDATTTVFDVKIFDIFRTLADCVDQSTYIILYDGSIFLLVRSSNVRRLLRTGRGRDYRPNGPLLRLVYPASCRGPSPGRRRRWDFRRIEKQKRNHFGAGSDGGDIVRITAGRRM